MTDHLADARSGLAKRLRTLSGAKRLRVASFAAEHYGGSLTEPMPAAGHCDWTFRILGLTGRGETADAALDAWVKAAMSCGAEVAA